MLLTERSQTICLSLVHLDERRRSAACQRPKERCILSLKLTETRFGRPGALQSLAQRRTFVFRRVSSFSCPGTYML
jgi:hypothetical protein